MIDLVEKQNAMHKFVAVAKIENYNYVLVLQSNGKEIKHKIHTLKQVSILDWENCGVDRGKSLIFKDKKENHGVITIYHNDEIIGLLYDLNDLEQYLDFDISTFSYKSVNKFLNTLKDNIIDSVDRYIKNVDGDNKNINTEEKLYFNLNQEFKIYKKFADTISNHKHSCRVNYYGELVILRNCKHDEYLQYLKDHENI